jgi:heme exporter protein C
MTTVSSTRASARPIKIPALLVGLTAVAVVVALQWIFLKAPVERSMGIVQKIFYFHVPSAYAMYLGAALCFVGSVGYLARGTLGWDALARAGADVAVLMGLMVMTSGPLWAAKAWGTYWTWDPRLTTSLLSLLIYVAYTLLRAFTGGGEAERRFAAALGVLGAANLPIIHYSVRKWGGLHPKVISTGGGGLGDPDMKTALLFGFVSFTLLAVTLVWYRARLHALGGRLEALEQEAVQAGVSGD